MLNICDDERGPKLRSRICFLVTFPLPLAQHTTIFNPVEQCFSRISLALEAPLLFIHHTGWTSDREMTTRARRQRRGRETHTLKERERENTQTQICKHDIKSHKAWCIHQKRWIPWNLLKHACASNTHLNARTLTHSSSPSHPLQMGSPPPLP